MPLHLNVSASLEILAAGLAGDMNAPGRSVFDPHFIVTQTEGMNNWLKQQLAASLGIAANCRFLKPTDLIHQLYFLLGGPANELLSAQNMRWLLYRILGEADFAALFPSVAAYYSSSGPDRDTKRMALAEKMADLFDQYQIYRPQMMREWNAGTISTAAKTDWQQYLWLRAKEASSFHLPDKTLLGDFILNNLQSGEATASLKARISSVHLFGLSITTDYHVQILHALSAVVDVHFHLLNPAPQVFWQDDRSEKQLALWRAKGFSTSGSGIAGNALLTGWGGVVQDMLSMLFQHDEFLNAYTELPAIMPGTGSLLQKIQHDVFHAAPTAERVVINEADLTDGSLTINACYTIAREVEVLYNYLVHQVANGGAMSPRDIVVMVSDVDAYAPYIKAVFGNAAHRFRFTIADESFAGGDSLFDALDALLRLTEEGFKAEAVMQLLEHRYIRARFGIGDVTKLRYLVNAANIRFGIEGRAEDDTRFVSWKHGLKRIMYGICMSGSEAYGSDDDYFYPLDLLEGAAAQDAVRFCHFAEVLMRSVEERQQSRGIVDWVAYIERLLTDLVYEPGEEADEQYQSLLRQLTDYNAVHEWMSEKISYEVFSRSFLQGLQSNTRTSLYANGGITFCSLIPMRSIPFKVVAMLGLNYDKFPRRDVAASFNLMTKAPKRGDRSTKEADKHLFLETLLSARQKLYISYLGRAAKDNSVLPPSSLVDELLDYIESGAPGVFNAQHKLTTLHPLQAFSHRYNAGDTRLYSYLQHQSGLKDRLQDAGRTPELPALDEISLEDLVRFFRNPIKAWYNKLLGIYYNEEESLLEETELFSLNRLQQWTFKNQLLSLDEPARRKLRDAAVRTGSLPLAGMGGLALQQVEEAVAPLRAVYQQSTGGMEERSLAFELLLDGCLLRGRLDGVFDRTALRICWSKEETKYLIDGYIHLLAGRAAGLIDGLSFLSSVKESAFPAATISAEEARRRLVELVGIYRAGHTAMVPFCSELALLLEAAELDEMDETAYTEAVRKALDGYFPCQDPYIMREFRNGFFKGRLEEWKLLYKALVAPLTQTYPSYFA